MKALILAAGLGTRLGQLSRTRPKCLQEIGGVPLLDHLLKKLTDVGIEEILVNTHYLASAVEVHIAKSQWATRVNLFHEPTLLGTLGTVRANLDFFSDEPGIVLHGDNYHVGNFTPLVHAFENRPLDIWMVAGAFRVNDPWNYGVFSTTKSGIVEGFWEKVDVPPSSLANAATYVFSKQVFEFIRNMNPTGQDISRDLLPELTSRILAIELSAPVVDIGTPERLELAQQIELSIRNYAERDAGSSRSQPQPKAGPEELGE